MTSAPVKAERPLVLRYHVGLNLRDNTEIAAFRRNAPNREQPLILVSWCKGRRRR
jgi:hypothetical protein